MKSIKFESSLALATRAMSRRPAVYAALAACIALLQSTTSTAQPTAQIGLNFPDATLGVNVSTTPPDCSGAIGPSHFVEFINGRFAVFNKTTGALVMGITDTAFWANAGVVVSNNFSLTAPRLIYDPLSQRWIAAELDYFTANKYVGTNDFLLAVSASSDPTGIWSAVKFKADPSGGRYADFTTLGVDASGVYLSADLFDGTQTAIAPTLAIIPKASLLVGSVKTNGLNIVATLSYGINGHIVQPAITSSNATSGEVMLGVESLGADFQTHTTLLSTDVQNVTTNTAASATLSAVAVTVPGYSVAFNPFQPDGSDNLDDNDLRFSASVYRVGDIVYAAHNIEVNNHAGIQWYVLNALNNSVIQSGQVADTNLDLFFPSIAANAQGNVVMAFNASSTNTFVSSYAVVGQTVSGTLSFGSLQLLKSGVASYQNPDPVAGDGSSRWGDYSSISVDPLNSSNFWTIQMIPASGTTWQTQITQLTIPQVSASPSLSGFLAGANFTISWPNTATGYLLQNSSDVSSSANWANVVQTPVAGANNTLNVTVPATGTATYFRLINPTP
jgi:hypothetical protein